MALTRSPPIVMLWLCLQSSLYLQGSNCHENPSLWGKKAGFLARTCMWQLDREVAVPALEELSVCVLLRLSLRTEWTAFAYKAPGNLTVELGLEGDNSHITAVLFGGKWPLNESLSSKDWHSVCLTWSATSQNLRLYVNGTRHLDVGVNSSVSGRLAPNGTMTLGVPHSVDESGAVRREDGKSLMGDIGLFRMWAREWRAEEMTHLGCVEGDVVSWDTRHWNYLFPLSCPPKADTTLRCDWSSYKIQMWVYVTNSNTSNTTNSSLEFITSHWMESIFSQNISVQKVLVSFPSRQCLAGNNPPALYIQRPKFPSQPCSFTFLLCVSSFFSKVYVSVSPKNSVEWVQAYITERLEAKFSYDSLTLMTDIHRLSIQPVVPKSCPEETLKTIYGVYVWSETLPQREEVMICQRPNHRRASRFCKLDINSDMTSWMDPNMTACKPLMIISDLDDVNVTADNAADVVQIIQDLIDVALGVASGGDGELSASEMVTVVGKLDDVVDVSVVTDILCNDIFSMISDILISRSDMNPVANMVLNLTERIGDKAVFSMDLFNVATPALAVSMNNVYPKTFSGITFCVSSFSAGMIPELMVNQSIVEAIPGTVASITLPPALQNQLGADRNKTRIQFQFYGVQDLFNDKDITVGAEGNWTLNSYVISASINNRTVSNLKQRVAVTLSNNRAKQEHEKVMCVFWDFRGNDGQGGWNSHGCETHVISAHQTSCFCDHLTSFAVLLDISRAPISDTDSEILTVISYLGCGISSIFLGITLMTYLAFGKLRRDYPSKILINLSAALLALNLLYLLNTWLSSFPSYGLCILTAMLMHYFLLAAFMWMGLEALHMYFALIKVFNVYVLSYILKFCVVGWGVPLLIVGLVLATDVDAYGNNMPAGAGQTSEPFCWIQSDVHFYVTVAGFILLILLCNTSVFVVVLIQIRRMRTNKPMGKLDSGSSMQDLRAAASLTFLLGLTWLTAFFSFGPGRMVMLYLFCVLNSLQGFFIFVFHCLMKENVRKQWRIHLTFDRLKPNDFSDWSRSLNASGQPKQKPDAHSHSMGSVDTSSIIRASESSSSTGSGPVHHRRE
ncbi:unnamed protein product [Lota lota]